MGIATTLSRMAWASTGWKFSLALRSLIAAQAPLPGARNTPTLAGALDNRRYPPVARMVTELLLVELTTLAVESPQTKEPVWLARAKVPAAKARLVAALPSPPGIMA